MGSCGKLTAAEKFSRESCKEMTTCSYYSLQLIGRITGEEDVQISSDEDDNEGDLDSDESDDNEQESNCIIDQNRNAVRFKGKQEREILMRAMTDWML